MKLNKSIIHCMNFGYHKHGIIIFSIHTQKLKIAVHTARMKNKICEVINFWYFLRRIIIFMFFQEQLLSLSRAG